MTQALELTSFKFLVALGGFKESNETETKLMGTKGENKFKCVVVPYFF